MSKELDGQIAKAMASVRRHCIPERIIEVVRHFRGEQVVMYSCHSNTVGKCSLTIAGGTTVLSYESVGSYNEGLHFRTYYGGELVFEAISSGLAETFQDKDPRLIMKYASGRKRLFVARFVPGIWMKALDLKGLLRQKERAERAAKRAQEKAAKAKPPKPHEHDSVIAERFGLKA